MKALSSTPAPQKEEEAVGRGREGEGRQLLCQVQVLELTLHKGATCRSGKPEERRKPGELIQRILRKIRRAGLKENKEPGALCGAETGEKEAENS